METNTAIGARDAIINMSVPEMKQRLYPMEKLGGIDCSYQADGWLNDLLFVTKQVVKHRGSLYGRTNYNDLVLPFLFSSSAQGLSSPEMLYRPHFAHGKPDDVNGHFSAY